MIGSPPQVQTRKARGGNSSAPSRAGNEWPARTAAADFPIVITAMPINPTQRRVALGVMIAILLIELASAPFAHLPVAHIDSFIPVLQSVMSITYLITAVLLFSQYSVRPRFAMLVMAGGYVFSGLFAFDQTLAFPGAYSAGVLVGNADTAVWLFVLWHTTFPLSVAIYALTKDASHDVRSTRSPMVGIFIAVTGVVVAVVGFTWAELITSAYLPKIFLAGGTVMDLTPVYYVDLYLWLLNSAALVLLVFRRRTILDLWLIVTLFAWWPMFLVPMYFVVVRFSIGWYVARSLAMLASSALLAILMAETTLLYARLASSIRLLRRERAERLTSVEAATSALAHEIRQPLSGIANMGAACVNWLKAAPANVERASECLTGIVDASHHAEEIIGSIAGLFRKEAGECTMLQLNDVCRDVVKLVQHDVLANRVSVRVRYRDDLPLISADHTQIQQVVLNLVRNAIDAMSGNRPAKERRLSLRTGFGGRSGVSLWVRDSGVGISEIDRRHIFEPFYTTKEHGMGLGLAICRTIIEDHGGTLRVAETNSQGSTFQIVLPVMDTSPREIEEPPASDVGYERTLRIMTLRT